MECDIDKIVRAIVNRHSHRTDLYIRKRLHELRPVAVGHSPGLTSLWATETERQLSKHKRTARPITQPKPEQLRLFDELSAGRRTFFGED